MLVSYKYLENLHVSFLFQYLKMNDFYKIVGCMYCEKVFSTSDVLQQHYLICKHNPCNQILGSPFYHRYCK